MSKKYRSIMEKLTREGVWCYETGRYAASRRVFARAYRLFEVHLKNDAVADRYRWTISQRLANALAALGETERAVRKGSCFLPVSLVLYEQSSAQG